MNNSTFFTLRFVSIETMKSHLLSVRISGVFSLIHIAVMSPIILVVFFFFLFKYFTKSS